MFVFFPFFLFYAVLMLNIIDHGLCYNASHLSVGNLAMTESFTQAPVTGTTANSTLFIKQVTTAHVVQYRLNIDHKK